MDISTTLDQFHDAACNSDYDRYFSLLADNAVFLGTDANERWDKSEFQVFAKPHFERRNGWKYKSIRRNTYTSVDNNVAWFDEVLESQKFGECRGSGVLIMTNDGWKIAQYHLVIPVPNELTSLLLNHISTE